MSLATRFRIVALSSLALLAAACGASNPPLPPAPKAPAPIASAPPSAITDPYAGVGVPRETPDAPFRAQPPDAAGAVQFAPPRIQAFALKNGIKVLFVERHDLPIVSARIVFASGAGDISGVRPGVASFAGSMLEQGTKTRDALKLSDDFEALGAGHSAWLEWDSAGASVKVLATKLDLALDLMQDVVQNPSFPEPEIERVKARRLASLQQEKNSPRAMVGNAIAAALYGRGHPYGNSLVGREDDVKKVTRDEIVRAYEKVFVPQRATIVVAGDITADALRQKLEPRFGAWTKNVPERASPPAAPAGGGKRVVFVDKPRATQSQVYLVDVGAARSLQDRHALSVMNAILGGMFSSRINLNLREAHAFTYGASSRFSLRHGAGPFMTGGAMVAEHTLDAAKELLAEVKKMHDAPVTAEELAEAKEAIKLALPGQFEGIDAIAAALADLAIYNLPLTEYETRLAKIDAVTVADVRRVAGSLLHPDRLKLVVVGDRQKFEPGLPGLDLGAPEERDAYGDVVH